MTREQALQEARKRGWTNPYAHKYSSDHVSGIGREYEVGEATKAQALRDAQIELLSAGFSPYF